MRIKGWLDSLVLAVVQHHPAHGYRIASELREAGVGDLADASLYPVLKRLQAAEYVAADWDMSGSGPARKVYTATKAGRKALADDVEEWATVRTGVDQIFARALEAKQ